MYDYRPGNIILGHKTKQLKIIDFEYIGKEKKINIENVRDLTKLIITQK